MAPGSVAGPTSIVASLGRPAVRVPVLSNRMTRARASVSSGPPPLTITPRRAAREIPATIAIGAASRSGHGVATTRTASPRTGSPDSEPGRRGDGQRERDEDEGVAVREADERRLAVLRLLDEADDPGVGALGGRRGGAKIERGPGVDGPRGDLVAFLAGHQAGLAGERGFVEDGRAPDDHPVDRHDFAGTDREQVAGDDGLDRGRLEPAIDDIAGRPAVPVRAARSVRGARGPARSAPTPRRSRA